MGNSKKTKHALFSSIVSLILCISMLLGSTYAWFTDTATTGMNLIQSGELKVDLVDENDDTLVGKSLTFQKHTNGAGEAILWEPGVTYETQKFYVKNEGNLSLKYKLAINGLDGDSKLLEAIDFYLIDGNGSQYSLSTEKSLAANEKSGALKLVGKMKTSAGNEYQNLKLDEISITVYATQASDEYDSYNNIYDLLADYSLFVTQTKMLKAGDDSIDFEMKYQGVVVATVSVPATAISDTSAPVTVTFDGIDPSETITVDEHTKAYAYDIDVSNLKDSLSAEQQIKVVLTAPNALPDAKVYHNGVLMENTTYDEVEGQITFNTDSFSPYAVSYLEYEVDTVDELREAAAVNNAYIKLTGNISAQMNKSVSGNACKEGYSWTSSSYKNPDNTFYFLVMVTGQSITLDLNGYTIETIDQLDDGYEYCGSTIVVEETGNLNITDTSAGQTGTIKTVGPHYLVWSPYAGESYVDIYGGIFMSDSYVGDKYGYGYPYNCAMIYGGYDDDGIGNINIYGGYYLYDNFNNNANIGSFNVGDKATNPSIIIHDGVMLINEWWKQKSGADDDSIFLEDGCRLEQVSETKVIDGISYNSWYKVVTESPKFETVFENTDTYLYRVGNSNTIKLGSLFETTNPNGAFSDNAAINVVITGMDANTNVTGTYTAASTAEEWANGTIKFTGTGPAKITINGYELLVEVVAGKNITVASELSSSVNNVLLNDIALTSSTTGLSLGSGKTLFGNGFTIDYAGYGNKSANRQGVIVLNSATMDNVKIIGDLYSTFTDASSDSGYAAAVYASGTSRITNSYISNCQVALRVQGTSCAVENTTLSGGRYANLQLKQGTLTLKDVVTTQDKVVVDGKTCLGFGIVVWEDAPAGTKIKIDGDLTQYNWVTSSDKTYMPGTAANYVDTAFSFSQFVYGSYVNLGIISISKNVLSSSIDVPSGYSAQDVSSTACVVTYDNTKSADAYNNMSLGYGGWVSTKQGSVDPTYTWTYPATYNSSSNTISASFEEGSSYTLDPNFLAAEKHNAALNVSVSMDGTDYTGKSITFTQSGDHTLTYTVTDPYNYNATAGQETTVHTFTIDVSVVATAPEAAHAEFTYQAGQSTKIVEIGGKKYVMPDVSATSSSVASVTVSGTTVYMPIVNVVYKDNTSDFYGYSPIFTAINIKDYAGGLPTGDSTTYSSSSTSLPANWGKSSGNPYINGAASSTADPVSYSSYGLCWQSKKGSDISASSANVLYYYTDNAGETYYYYVQYYFAAHDCPSTCFTPDTLITLSDGTQKRVDELSATDRIISWDFFAGDYVEKDISLLVNHGAEQYEVIYTTYSDGTLLKTIGEHGVFDYDLNKFVYVTADNVNDFVGHRFVKQNLNGGYDVVTMTDGYAKSEYTEAWSVSSAETSNAFASGLLTVAPPEDFYNWIEMDGKLHYDVEQFMADVETYGLYTYEDFADYVTYEQFVEWNGAYLKVAVEKGYFTFDYILELIELYKQWMP